MNFGELMRHEREKRRISIECVSHATKKSVAYWSMIERGIKPAPSDELISEAAKVIGFDVDAAFVAAGRLPPDMKAKIGDVVALFRSQMGAQAAQAMCG